MSRFLGFSLAVWSAAAPRSAIGSATRCRSASSASMSSGDNWISAWCVRQGKAS